MLDCQKEESVWNQSWIMLFSEFIINTYYIAQGGFSFFNKHLVLHYLVIEEFFICSFLPLFRQSKSPTPADVYQSSISKQNNFSLYVEHSKHHKKSSFPSFSPRRKKSKEQRDNIDGDKAKVKYEKHERSGHEKSNMNGTELKILEKRYLITSSIKLKYSYIFV